MQAGNRSPSSLKVDTNVFKPILRAYALGYLTVTGPRLFSLLKILGRKDKSSGEKFDLFCYILKTSVQLNRFPATCAIIVAGSTVLPKIILRCLQDLAAAVGSRSFDLHFRNYVRIVKFTSAFASAWLSFRLLNSKTTSSPSSWAGPRPYSDPPLNPLAASGKSTPVLKAEGASTSDVPSRPLQPLAGKTVDLTLLAFTRACDVLVGNLWHLCSRRRQQSGTYTRGEHLISSLTDSWIFSLSSSAIMWAWFYYPDRLSRAYNIWISEAAQIDSRLIEALRLARQGKWVYGKDTGLAYVLSSLCTDLGLPPEWGDPAVTIPVPCHLVHLHSGPNCEYHALSRFVRTFRFALSTYLPLQLALRLRSTSKQPLSHRLLSTLKSSARSSAFLSLFVTLFYYSVCLSRSRVGPLFWTPPSQPSTLSSQPTLKAPPPTKLQLPFPPPSPSPPPTETPTTTTSTTTPFPTPQTIDSGLCVLSGCLTCGWSILLEPPARVQEIAFFVAPRALATLIPRSYPKQHMWKEALVFAGSTTVVLMSVLDEGEWRFVRKGPRGVLGRVLRGVLKG